MFEILSKLKLPGFDSGNWRSRIRHYVKVHEKYRSLEEWKGKDVDMVYEDSKGVLTKILVEKGHLDDSWSQAKSSEYWLEVKTTTWKCRARFFLTDPEYERV